ncbi:MAG: exosortase family protein XrtF [Flavobacteriales bacterium CG_4_9_14_3_um_filter_40_17]|nr:MAG: exosortase family protein XrtF [Flavobacteriales bacterium CG_4_9_14_3_um_filter_40_17]
MKFDTTYIRILVINLLKNQMYSAIYQPYKTVIHFLLRFFGVYGGLSFLYFYYLKAFELQVDPFTVWIGKLSKRIIELFGYKSRILSEPGIPNLQLYINDSYVARIIEGCNAASILILFAAFIIAFSGKIKSLIRFLVIGIFSISVINILRIAFLAITLYKFPQHSEWLHQLVFPAIIYGFTIVLWLIWVIKFSKK